ncbi:hypothetical protein WKK05_11995 [Nostoc sp. UHCC 0302]|uniref:hypothetical protein n=1 Tax=Nostoc sp. UHCC 0302 TaxID=3134896 RepID=UPI00311C958A
MTHPEEVGFNVYIMYNRSTLTVRGLSIKECRDLLNIHSRGTINEYLKTLNLFGHRHLNWDELRRVLELQIFLGLKHGRNSKEMFSRISRQRLVELFTEHGIDIEARMQYLQNKYTQTNNT